MLALRAELRKRGGFAGKDEPNLGDVLDLVALGTVADVVPLDFNNRVLVAQGLRRIRAGRMQEGVRALFAVAGHDPSRASGFDLGFLLGAAAQRGRTSVRHEPGNRVPDDRRSRARPRDRAQLDDLNRARRAIEAGMQALADELMAELSVGESSSISFMTRAGTRAWSASSPGASRIATTARPSPSPRPVPARSAARAGRLRACICATR